MTEGSGLKAGQTGDEGWPLASLPRSLMPRQSSQQDLNKITKKKKRKKEEQRN